MRKTIKNIVYYYLYGMERAQYWTSLLFVCALGVALAGTLISHHSFWHAFLGSLTFFCVGLKSAWAGIGYLVYPEETATRMGWHRGHFEIEAGAAHLGLAIAGILSPLYHGWVVPIALVATILYLGSFYAHVFAHPQSSRFGLFNWFKKPHKAGGPMLYSSIAIIGSLIATLILHLMTK